MRDGRRQITTFRLAGAELSLADNAALIAFLMTQ
jgi:hypothetical protein